MIDPIDLAEEFDQSPEWQEFCRQWAGERQKYDVPEQRQGQQLMNALYDFRPDLYNYVTGTLFDPFYQDKHIETFLKKLYDRFIMTLEDK